MWADADGCTIHCHLFRQILGLMQDALNARSRSCTSEKCLWIKEETCAILKITQILSSLSFWTESQEDSPQPLHCRQLATHVSMMASQQYEEEKLCFWRWLGSLIKVRILTDNEAAWQACFPLLCIPERTDIYIRRTGLLANSLFELCLRCHLYSF